MTFKATGVGHNGKQLYTFQVTFYEPVEVEVRLGIWEWEWVKTWCVSAG